MREFARCVACGVGARVLLAIPSLLLHMLVSIPRFPEPFFFFWFVAATSCAIVVIVVGSVGEFTPYLWYLTASPPDDGASRGWSLIAHPGDSTASARPSPLRRGPRHA